MRKNKIHTGLVLKYPIRYKYGKKGYAHMAYVVGYPVTALEDSKSKLKPLLTEALINYLRWCVSDGDPFPMPPKKTTSQDFIRIGVC